MLKNTNMGSLNKYLVAMKAPSLQHYQDLQHLIINNPTSLHLKTKMLHHHILWEQMKLKTESCSCNSHTCFS